jgi:pilus assembly protein Flp/PilA
MVRSTVSEDGATAVEYALLVALIALVIFAAVGAIGTALIGVFNEAAAMFTP